MKVIYGIGKIKSVFKNTVMAIGVFDGLHVGHQELIQRAMRQAKKINGQALVMTFHPHPVHVLKPNIYQPLIVSLPYRLKLIERMGVASCVVVRFTKQFSHLSPESFVKKYIASKVRPKEIFVGNDFRFGENRSGSLEYFQTLGRDHGFKVNIVDTLKVGKKKIGSTMIRQFILDGKLNKAKKLLGRNLSVMGTVIKGDRRGQTLGFPTANLDPKNEIIPPLGVYAVKCELNNKNHLGMANVGYRPSFRTDKKKIGIEVHLFGAHRKFYGKKIVVEFIKRLRNEKTFKTEQELIAQLKKDELRAKKYLKI